MTRTRFLGIAVFAMLALLLSVVLIARSGGAPAQADAPHEGLDFATGIDVDGDGTNDCGTGVPLAVGDGAPDAVPVEVTDTTCAAGADAKLDVRLYLMDNGGISYVGVDSAINYSGLSLLGNPEFLYDACGKPAFYTVPAFVAAGCSTGIGTPASTSVGILVRYRFACSTGGEINLVHDGFATALVDESSVSHIEGGPDTLSVTCGDEAPPPPTSALNFALGIDVDGDGTNDCGTGVPLEVGDGAPDAVPVEVTNTDCTADADAELDVRVYLMDGAGLAYAAVGAQIEYQGVTSLGAAHPVWQGCAIAYVFAEPGWEHAGCAVGPGAPDRTDLGVMSTFSLSCTAPGTVALGRDSNETMLIDDSDEHREGGWDELSIGCGGQPPPTLGPSPTPYLGTPTPTPCIDCPSPQFALGIDVNGDGTNDCGTGVPRNVGDGAPDAVFVEVTDHTCAGVIGGTLSVRVYLTDRRGISYEAQESLVRYAGITSKGRGDAMWEGCVFEATAPAMQGREAVGCTIGVAPAVAVDHEGLMSSFTYTCSATGEVRLDHAPGATLLLGRNAVLLRERNGNDTLTIVCGAAATGDSDCNGVVNSVDAMVILQFTAGLLPNVPCPAAADVDANDTINAIDAALILQAEAFACGLLEFC